jgi:SAM-dependent methyltransferase
MQPSITDSNPTNGAPNDPVRAAHLQALRDEEVGVRHRIQHFYLPLFLEHARALGRSPSSMRVLDCGCGNGASAEYVAEAGFDAFGIDLASFRVEQWTERVKLPRVSLLAADSTRLPFADGSFDAVLSCGMIEHIGVSEGCTPDYWVKPLPNQAALRQDFLAESMRVLKPDGVLFVDHPNGRFPIDFWHGDHRARPRLHSPREEFLPNFSVVAALAKKVSPTCTVRAISPAGRFTFLRSRRRWYGKIFTGALRMYFDVLRYPPFSLLAASALNPYLVIRISR